MNIVINNDCNIQSAYIDVIYEVLNKSKDIEGVSDNTEVSVSIVDNLQIQKLNNKYRQIDRATDVLSFPMFERDALSNKEVYKNQVVLLGDIIISIDKAMEQAKEYGHSVEREIGFLAVHGFLHLLGYDHINDADEKVMFEKQNKILNLVGLSR